MIAEGDAGRPRFRLATPADWTDLDLAPATRRRSADRLVGLLAGPDAGASAVRDEVTSLLLGAAEDAAAHGAFFASLLSDVVEGHPVSASLVVSLRSDAGDGEAGDLDALAEQLRLRPGPGAAAPQTAVVRLPAGPAVRLRSRATARAGGTGGGAGRIEVESLQYFVPVPGGGDLLALSFSTPNLALADSFVELFDAMAESLSWE